MDAPTADDVKAATELEDLTGAADAKVARVVAVANALFQRITGLTFATVATSDEPLVFEAVKGLSEMTVQQDSPERLETMADWDLIASFNAGNYSETRRTPEDAMKARLIVAWPWLSTLLWQLLTPDQFDYWTMFFSGVRAPASEVQEVDWAAGEDLLGGSYSSEYLWGA